jgi:hypothetical protein
VSSDDWAIPCVGGQTMDSLQAHWAVSDSVTLDARLPSYSSHSLSHRVLVPTVFLVRCIALTSAVPIQRIVVSILPNRTAQQVISIASQILSHLMNKMPAEISGLSTLGNPLLCSNTKQKPCQTNAALVCSGCNMVQVCLSSF